MVVILINCIFMASNEEIPAAEWVIISFGQFISVLVQFFY